jgi:tetratricopeptide (TPR) repeat protein
MKLSIGILLAITSIALGQPAPGSFEDLSAKAKQAYEANRDDEARKLFSDAVRLRPEWSEGWWGLGMLDYDHDRYSECRDELKRMVELDSSAVPGWALLGLCEFRTQEYDRSFENLKKAHMMVPVKGASGSLLDMANYHLAMLLTKQGAFEVAQEVFVHVALRVRNNSEMMFATGVTSLRMPVLPSDVPADQRDVVTLAGKAFWDLSIEPPEKAEADFKELVSRYPSFPNVHYLYGTFLGAHHPEQCASEFLAELRVNPGSIPARVQLTLRYLVEGKPDEALKYARDAVKRSPDSVGAQLALGEALRASGDEEQALRAYLAAEGLDPVSPRIRLYVSNSYRALGRTADMRREQGEYRRLKEGQQNWP